MTRKVASTSSVAGGQFAAVLYLSQRRCVHAAVLADLQLGQMEPEGLHLPDQVLQLSVRLPRGAGGGQAGLDRAEIGQQLGRGAVREIGVPPAGRRDPVRCEQQGDPVQLPGGSGDQVADDLRVFGPGIIDDLADGR